jgi:DNA-binding NarL/FixJ family response regulator
MPRTQQGQRVLVVDDDRDLRRLVKRLLEPLGYVVHEASTAGAALATAARERPAVVLLDVHLPDIPGYEVLRRLRDEFGDGLAIVFVSGKRTEEFDRTAGMLLGADDSIDRSSAARAPETSNLTPRELEVLKLLADGLGQKKIAQSLFITQKTVATHIQRILTKLDVHSRAEAVAYAHRNQLFH